MQNKIYRFFYIIFPLILYYILSEIVFLLYRGALTVFHMDPHQLNLLLVNILVCCSNILICLFLYHKDEQKRAKPSPDKKMSFRHSIGFLILGAVLSQILNLLIMKSPLPKLFPGYIDSFSSLTNDQISFLFLIWTVIAAPVSEELLFRCLIFKRMRSVFSPKLSILASALLFGLIHGNLLQFLYSFLIGIILAWSLEYTDSIFAPLLIHIGANLWSILIISL